MGVSASRAETVPVDPAELLDGFFRNVERMPGATALTRGPETLTYAQLGDKVLAVAAALQSRGVLAGEHVALVCPESADRIPALIAIVTAGAACLPIGADQPNARTRALLHGSGVEFALVTGDSWPDVLDDCGVPALTVADAEIVGDPALFEPVPTAPALHDGDASVAGMLDTLSAGGAIVIEAHRHMRVIETAAPRCR